MKKETVEDPKDLHLEACDDPADSEKVLNWLNTLAEPADMSSTEFSSESHASSLQECSQDESSMDIGSDECVMKRDERSVTARFRRVAAEVRHAEKMKTDGAVEQKLSSSLPSNSSEIFVSAEDKQSKRCLREKYNLKLDGRKMVSSASRRLEQLGHKEEKRPRLILVRKAVQTQGIDGRVTSPGETHDNRVDHIHPKKRKMKGKSLVFTYNLEEEKPCSIPDEGQFREEEEDEIMSSPSLPSLNEEEKERYVRYRKRKTVYAEKMRKPKQGSRDKLWSSNWQAPKEDFLTNDYYFYDEDKDKPTEIDDAPWFDQVCTFTPASNEIGMHDARGDVNDDVYDNKDWVEVRRAALASRPTAACPYLCHRFCEAESNGCLRSCHTSCNHGMVDVIDLTSSPSKGTSDGDKFDQVRYGEDKGLALGCISEANLFESECYQ